MSRIPKRVKCSVCRKAWATLGLPSNLTAQFVRNTAINDRTREQFRFTFGRKKADKLRTTKDVDAAFSDVARRYPHLMPGYKRGKQYDMNSAADRASLGTPDVISRDPFPREKITDDGRLHGERRVM